MKSIYLISMGAVALCFSCSGDEPVAAPTTLYTYSAKIADTTVAFDSNPYDFAGKIHNEILGSCMDNTALPVTVSGIIDLVESTAGTNTAFIALQTSAYQKLSVTKAQSILSDSDCVATAVSGATISTAAKTALALFAAEFIKRCKATDDYGSIYTLITGFESDIVVDTSLSQHDKQVLLTTAAIVRYSQFTRKRPKKNTDLDWEHNMFHLAGTIEGTSSGTAEAITSAVAIGIAENN